MAENDASTFPSPMKSVGRNQSTQKTWEEEETKRKKERENEMQTFSRDNGEEERRWRTLSFVSFSFSKSESGGGENAKIAEMSAMDPNATATSHGVSPSPK